MRSCELIRRSIGAVRSPCVDDRKIVDLPIRCRPVRIKLLAGLGGCLLDVFPDMTSVVQGSECADAPGNSVRARLAGTQPLSDDSDGIVVQPFPHERN
jgi:hypothetical protein